MSNHNSPYDLLVLGAGMAGLTASTRAIQDGARVIVVEKGNAVGGSANYAGFIWTAPDEATMLQHNPKADPQLSTKIVREYESALAWVKSLGVDVQDPVTVLGFGRGCQTDIAQMLTTCQRIIRDKGELLLNATPDHLLIDNGAVVGARITTSDGQTREIRAHHTLLATGGFGGNPDLRAERIHPQARDLPLRANPHSTGDGLRLGTEAGANSGPVNAGFYGHLIPSQIPLDDPLDFVTLSFYHSEHSVLLNLKGERFCDETIGDHLSTLELIEQPEARALMIYDQRTHEDWMMRPYVKGANVIDRFQVAYKRGARCAVADSLDDFAALPTEWGYPGDQVVDSLAAYNQGCHTGELSPPRLKDKAHLAKPPFYVIEVIPAITFTFEGLAIDTHARVLDKTGSPIPGLLAAGADAGGVYVKAYAGGLAASLIFGLQAAKTAMGG